MNPVRVPIVLWAVIAPSDFLSQNFAMVFGVPMQYPLL